MATVIKEGVARTIEPKPQSMSQERRNQIAQALVAIMVREKLGDLVGPDGHRRLGTVVQQLQTLGVSNITIEELKKFLWPVVETVLGERFFL